MAVQLVGVRNGLIGLPHAVLPGKTHTQLEEAHAFGCTPTLKEKKHSMEELHTVNVLLKTIALMTQVLRMSWFSANPIHQHRSWLWMMFPLLKQKPLHLW
jgi:hypothetical protein